MNKLTRIKFLEQKIFQAHELMHQGKYGEAENILHDAMLCNKNGVDIKIKTETVSDLQMKDFDQGFRNLCIKFNQQSAYLTHVVQKYEDGKVLVKFRSGGIGWISKILDTVGIQLLEQYQKNAPGNLQFLNKSRREVK